MKIISWNVNGIRAVHRYGFLDWFKSEKPDILCLQEIKAQKEQIPEDLLNIQGYKLIINSAKRKGYAGVAIYTSKKVKIKSKKLGIERFDSEGRIIELEIDKCRLINVYMPHGGRQKENLDYKLECFDHLIKYLSAKKDEKVVLIGDINIAHKEIDLARPKSNKNNIMFTPKEREQIDRILGLGFVDTFRILNKSRGNYTWWPYAFEARKRNLGWRIDYIFVSSSLKDKIKHSDILKKVRGSDHCPISLGLK